MHRDASGWAAARCVGAWVQQQLTGLQDAKYLQQVADQLHAVLNLFIYNIDGSTTQQLTEQAGACRDSDQVQQALLQHAQAVGWPALQRCFFQDQYETWATTVLTGEHHEIILACYILAPRHLSLLLPVALSASCGS
jgi:hypothetical protein